MPFIRWYSAQTECHSAHSWPTINQLHRGGWRGGKPLFSLCTHLSLWLTPSLSHSIFLWQHQIHTCPPSSCFLLLYFPLSPHTLLLSSLIPIGCLWAVPWGIMTMGILFWASVSPWLVEKWLKSKAQTQYVIGVETANTMLALLLVGVLAYALHSIADRGLELYS